MIETVFLLPFKKGDLSEWLKEHAWKVCIRETVSRVRIPQSPQMQNNTPWLRRGCFISRYEVPTLSEAEAIPEATFNLLILVFLQK